LFIIISEDDRQQRLKDWWCVLLLAAIVTALFSDVLFLGNNFYVRDLFVYHFPMKHVVREMVSRGEFPWWNPYFASGQPMAANPAYEIFYPPQWLIFLGPFTFGFALHVLVHVYLAAIGAFLLFRSMALRRDASVFGALSFALSGFLLGTATNLPTFFVWSWAGFAGWAALRVIRGGSIALPSIIFAMPILVGEPVSLLQLFGLMFILAGLKSARRLAMTIASAALIAAVQLVPAVDHAHDSIRSRGLAYEAVADFSLPPARAIEFISPFAIPPVNAEGKQRTHYFMTLYCGLAALILFVAAIATRQRGWLLVTAIALVSYLMALGDKTPLLRLLYACGIRFIRYPQKFIAIGIITMIGFATFAAHRLLDGDTKLRRAVIIAGAAITVIALFTPGAAAAIIAAAWTIVLWRVGTNRAWHLIVIALLLFDLGIVANRVMLRHPRRFFTPPPSVIAFARPFDGYAVFQRGEWAVPYFGAMYNVISPALNTRNALRPYTPAAWGIRTALDMDFDETDLLPTHDLLDSMQRLGKSGFVRWSEPFIQLSNVHYIIDYNPHGSIQSPIVIRRVPNQGRYWFARILAPISDFEQAIRGPIANGVAFTDPAFTPAPAPATITNVVESSHAADIDVDSTGRSFLVATITRHKYWRATIDGQPAPLVPANIAYQGLIVPAGRHHIAFRYWNPIVVVSGVISALTLFVVLASLLWKRRGHAVEIRRGTISFRA